MNNPKQKLSHMRIDYNLIKRILMLVIPFLLMDIIIRIVAMDVNYHQNSMIFPSILFSISWIAIIIITSSCLKGRAGQIFYGVCFSLFFIMFFAHLIYYPYTGFFFRFSLLQSAKEGGDYVFDTIKNAGLWSNFCSLLVLVLGVFAIVKFPKAKSLKWRELLISFLVFLLVHFITPVFFGHANMSLEWDTWRNPKNVYENFSDCNKNIKICGLYEYTIRDIYVTFLRPGDKQDPEEIKFLEKEYSTFTVHEENEYTGIFKGKNVIFLQLEGIDSWLLNPEDMPNLYKLQQNSINFDNHYSYYTGGGSTFNSELAATTGFITPMSYTKNPYSFNTNYFPGSLPNQLKQHGYSADAFHMNSGEYYSRELNYLNWGYDHYYSLMDDGGKYKDKSYQLDSELIENDFFYDKMFCREEPFMNYIITFSNHTPFELDSDMAKLLVKKVYGSNGDVPKMDEEEAARFFVGETDRMVGLLMKALEDNNLLENTVIVAFADHYLYTLTDKTILDRNKEHTNNNLINNTPFFIWSYGMEETHVDKVNSQLDILPTVLNMLGIEYYNEYYIGNDIFDKNFPGYVFFSDYSWYDGINYVEYGNVTNNNDADPSYINDTNILINELINRNDLTLKYDYFRKSTH